MLIGNSDRNNVNMRHNFFIKIWNIAFKVYLHFRICLLRRLKLPRNKIFLQKAINYTASVFEWQRPWLSESWSVWLRLLLPMIFLIKYVNGTYELSYA